MLTREENLRTTALESYQTAKSSEDPQKQVALYTTAITTLNDLGEALTDDDRTLIARCQNNMGMAYATLGECEKSIEAYQQSISFINNIKKPTAEHYTYLTGMHLNLCYRFIDFSIYRKMDSFKPKAAEYCKKATRDLDKLFETPYGDLSDNELRVIGRLHYLLAYCGTDQERNENDEYHSAKFTLKKIKDIRAGEFDDLHIIGMCNHHIGNIHLDAGMPDAAIPYFTEAVTYYSNSKSKLAEPQIPEIKALIEEINNTEKHYVLAPLPRQFSI